MPRYYDDSDYEEDIREHRGRRQAAPQQPVKQRVRPTFNWATLDRQETNIAVKLTRAAFDEIREELDSKMHSYFSHNADNNPPDAEELEGIREWERDSRDYVIHGEPCTRDAIMRQLSIQLKYAFYRAQQ